MPQIIVDHSDGLDFDRRAFAGELHALIAKTIDAPVSDCKTRFRRIEESFIADGDPAQAMVHLQIRMLDGRSTEAKAGLSEQALALLQEHVTGDRLHLAVEIVDMDRATYRKTYSAAG
ncbi:hypothetical protein GCM10010193_46540 [Kitasatospora atroaurantiaca]|uniref:5-carboxymethyl-2-hydroxymuconate isomerase n=1 Tax=Kitasatospora atroaurantiaca TaxID=285545 RepID=A0A561EZD3_9ACTN|nr:isomerase [Kitasatospora atroaurantiaca]TWE20965.1 5-carboxymethyl-2-hydroxymuconate isomerase [Kitasatospora atroaurantiaca]